MQASRLRQRAPQRGQPPGGRAVQLQPLVPQLYAAQHGRVHSGLQQDGPACLLSQTVAQGTTLRLIQRHGAHGLHGQNAARLIQQRLILLQAAMPSADFPHSIFKKFST